MTNSPFNVVLIHPEIGGNTGSIGRTCVALNARLHLIRPYGFSLDEKQVRRAGLDYWKHVQLSEYDSFNDFVENEQIQPCELFLHSRFAQKSIYAAKYPKRSFLIFGAETKGIPKDILSRYSNHLYQIPTLSEQIRSLNLSNAANIVLYECYRQSLI